MDERDDKRFEPPAGARTVWSRPLVKVFAASESELHSATTPDGLGDQLS
jgi:hypothetical protein